MLRGLHYAPGYASIVGVGQVLGAVQSADECREGCRVPKALPAPNRRPKAYMYMSNSK